LGALKEFFQPHYFPAMPLAPAGLFSLENIAFSGHSVGKYVRHPAELSQKTPVEPAIYRQLL
jgi:hypothetical protein